MWKSRDSQGRSTYLIFLVCHVTINNIARDARVPTNCKSNQTTIGRYGSIEGIWQ